MGINQGTYTAPFTAGDNDVSQSQGSSLNEEGGQWPAAFPYLGFDDHAFGQAVRVGFEIEEFGLQEDGFFQFIQVDPLFGGNLHGKNFTTHFLEYHFVLQEFCSHLFGIGVWPVDFVDGDDNGDGGSFGVVNGFYGLRHDAIVGGNHQDHDIGRRGTTGAHATKSLVAWRIDESDLVS